MKMHESSQKRNSKDSDNEYKSSPVQKIEKTPQVLRTQELHQMLSPFWAWRTLSR